MGKRISAALITLSALFSSQLAATIMVPIQVGDITIFIPVDEPPLPQPDVFTVIEDTTTPIDVLSNDEDEELQQVQVTVVSNVTNGTLVQSGNQFSYTPPLNQWGENYDSFTYFLTDIEGNVSETVTASINVTGVNDAPVNSNSQIVVTSSIPEDSSYPFNGLEGFSDADQDPLTVVSAVANNGSATINGSQVTFFPAQDFYGSAHVDVTVRDNNDSATIRWLFTVHNTPDPTSVSSFVVTNEANRTETGIYVTDPDGYPESFSIDVTGPYSFEKDITWSNHSCPNPNSPSVCYYAYGIGTDLPDGTYTLSLSGKDDAGVAFSVPNKTFQIATGASVINAIDDSFTVDSDAVDDALYVMNNELSLNTSTISLDAITRQPTEGTVRIENNYVLYTPSPSSSATSDSFEYQIRNQNNQTARATANIRISRTAARPSSTKPATDFRIQWNGEATRSITVMEDTNIQFTWQPSPSSGVIKYYVGENNKWTTCSDGTRVANSCLANTTGTQLTYAFKATRTMEFSVVACVESMLIGPDLCSIQSDSVTVNVITLNLDVSVDETLIRPGSPIVFTWPRPTGVSNDLTYKVELDRPEPEGEQQVQNWENLAPKTTYDSQTNLVTRKATLHAKGDWVYRITACSDAMGGCGTQPSLVTIRVEDVPIPAPSNVTISPASPVVNEEAEITWDAVDGHGISYQIHRRAQGSSTWIVVDNYEPGLSKKYTFQTAGQYDIRVRGCHNVSGCSDNWSQITVDVLDLPQNTRKVIFIHTDLLGSPVAETQKQGN